MNGQTRAWLTSGRAALLVLWVALSLLVVSCSAPVGAVRVDPSVVYRELTGSVLTTGGLSRFSRTVLFLQDLAVAFSTQGNPKTVEGVRRILLLDAGTK